jgi:hypothetical protein
MFKLAFKIIVKVKAKRQIDFFMTARFGGVLLVLALFHLPAGVDMPGLWPPGGPHIA